MLLARTNNKTSIRLYVNFSTRMSETEAAAGYDCDWVELIVHSREIRDLGIEERCPIPISNAWCPKRDTPDGRAFRQIKLHEQRIEFCKSSAKRVTNLQIQQEVSRCAACTGDS
jgi:hypothetical protein